MNDGASIAVNIQWRNCEYGWMSERKRRKRSIDIADRVIDGWGAYGGL